uniref:E3 SUMO-protein ligase gei-17 (inferred by orthology to a C. elegans protein) n=1 Tax=Anisakis simplex TaxID=6269 RepID=A0A0M3JSL8_ANISI
LQQFRVNELHVLLSTFRCPKLGKKHELIQRCIGLLQNSRNQGAVMQKIHEINASRRYHALSTQSSTNSNSSTSSGGQSYQMDAGSSLSGAAAAAAAAAQAAVAAQAAAAHQSLYTPQAIQPNMIQRQPHHFMPSAQPPHSFTSHSLFNRARSLRIVKLPFYDKTKTLLELSELPASSSTIRQTLRSAFKFIVPSDVLRLLNYRNEPAVLPRVEVQMRFFLLDPSKEQADDFPPNCEVKIDNTGVPLPNVIPTNKPNVEPKRPSRPVNITPFVQYHREVDKEHKVLIEWSADRRAWAVGIFVVNRLTSEILLKRLVSNVHARRDLFVTKRAISEKLRDDDEDDGVQMESIKFTLLCPLGRTRMVTPVKGYDCEHLQCFDLMLYLKMNEKRPTWKCAICDKSVTYENLIIDGYFEQVLKKASRNVTEVELLADGEWRPVVEQRDESLSDGADDEIPSKKLRSFAACPLNSHHRISSAPSITAQCNSNSNAAGMCASSSAAAFDDDVIVLGDSDDEVEEVVSASASTAALTNLRLNGAVINNNSSSSSGSMNNTRGLPTYHQQQHSTSSSSSVMFPSADSRSNSVSNQSIICIDLDDSDPTEAAAQMRSESQSSSQSLSKSHNAITTSRSLHSPPITNSNNQYFSLISQQQINVSTAAAAAACVSSATAVSSNQTPPSSAQFFPFYSPPPPPPPTLPSSAAAGIPFIHGLDTTYPVFQDPYNPIIAEQLRNFMASIHQTAGSSRRYN